MTILIGDAVTELRRLGSDRFDCIVTSPPYFKHRDYGHEAQIGQESTLDTYLKHITEVLAECYRVLSPTGTLWLVLGDTYSKKGGLHGVPWRVAFEAERVGFLLRQEIIWHKPNGLPQSVKDRFSTFHETVFLLSKRRAYYFNADLVREPAVTNRKPGQQVRETKHYGAQNGGNAGLSKFLQRYHTGNPPTDRNRRSVWTIAPSVYKGAHFATFPEELVRICLLAGCIENGEVLDPFFGAGTVGVVAKRLGLSYVGIELSADAATLAKERLGE